MALPERRDPDERRTEIQRDWENRRVEEREAAAGGWFAWWWLWMLILVAIVWFAGWGWGGYGGWWGWGGSRPVATTNNVRVAAEGAPLLDATNKTAFVGKLVTLNPVQVQTKVNDQVLWVGGNNTSPMLVVLTGADNSAANAKVGQGDWISAYGSVEKAPPAAQAKQQWSLDDNGTKRLEQQGAYLQATQVQKVQH